MGSPARRGEGTADRIASPCHRCASRTPRRRPRRPLSSRADPRSSDRSTWSARRTTSLRSPVCACSRGEGTPSTRGWPRALDLDAYRARHGDDMPYGMPRVVTPGAPDAWLTALARYGRLTLAEVLAPAMELCEGFPVFPRLAAGLAIWEQQIRAWPSTAAVFLPGGRAPRAGEILVQRELGDLFRRLAAIEHAHDTRGRAAAIMAARDARYVGDIARELAAFCAR